MTTQTTPTTPTILERIEYLELKASATTDLVSEIETLKAEIAMLHEQIFGNQAPAAVRPVKTVGVVHPADGKRHLSPEAKKHISEALKAKAAARKLAKEAEQAPAETK